MQSWIANQLLHCPLPSPSISANHPSIRQSSKHQTRSYLQERDKKKQKGHHFGLVFPPFFTFRASFPRSLFIPSTLPFPSLPVRLFFPAAVSPFHKHTQSQFLALFIHFLPLLRFHPLPPRHRHDHPTTLLPPPQLRETFQKPVQASISSSY